MRKEMHMRHQNITFSIPEDLKTSLLNHVDKRGMSRFISNAIQKALEEDERKKEQELDSAYEAANQDLERMETIQEWNSSDDITDLLDDEDWNWLKNPPKQKKQKKQI